MVYQSTTFGRAKDLTSGISNEELIGDKSVILLLNSIHKRDPFTVVNETNNQFNALCNLRRGATEAMKKFEMSLAAQVVEINSIEDLTKIPECLTGLLLLYSYHVYDSARMSILATASPELDKFQKVPTNDGYLKAVT